MGKLDEVVKEAWEKILRQAPEIAESVSRQIRRQVDEANKFIDATKRTDVELSDMLPSKKSMPDGPSTPPKDYNFYFEFELDPKDWAKSRDVHFRRSNEALEKMFKDFPEIQELFELMSPGISKRISSKGGRQNPLADFAIWHHAHPDSVGGRHGVMQLVPKFQHTPGSEWWRILHPGQHGGGGFSIWGKK